jgi:hypothetical protein
LGNCFALSQPWLEVSSPRATFRDQGAMETRDSMGRSNAVRR